MFGVLLGSRIKRGGKKGNRGEMREVIKGYRGEGCKGKELILCLLFFSLPEYLRGKKMCLCCFLR